MRKKLFTLTTGLFLFGMLGIANAELLTYEFSGTVSSTNGNTYTWLDPSVIVGDPVKVTISFNSTPTYHYDYSHIDSYFNRTESYYYSNYNNTDFSVDIGNGKYSFSTAGLGGSGYSQNQSHVQDRPTRLDTYAAADIIQINHMSNIMEMYPDSYSERWIEFDFELFTNGLSSSYLPTSQSVLDDLDWVSSMSRFRDYPQSFGNPDYVYFKIENIKITSGRTDLNSSPVLDEIGNKEIGEGERLDFAITATDPNVNDMLTFSATNLPDGASFFQKQQPFHGHQHTNKLAIMKMFNSVFKTMVIQLRLTVN